MINPHLPNTLKPGHPRRTLLHALLAVGAQAERLQVRFVSLDGATQEPWPG